jgi:hypothetical protein
MNLNETSYVTLGMRQRRYRSLRKEVDRVSFVLEIKPRMEKTPPNAENSDLVKNSVLYKEFLAEREEILKHKWIESEKVGHDIGFEKALLDWIVKYRSAWRERRQREFQPQSR